MPISHPVHQSVSPPELAASHRSSHGEVWACRVPRETEPVARERQRPTARAGAAPAAATAGKYHTNTPTLAQGQALGGQGQSCCDALLPGPFTLHHVTCVVYSTVSCFVETQTGVPDRIFAISKARPRPQQTQFSTRVTSPYPPLLPLFLRVVGREKRPSRLQTGERRARSVNKGSATSP